MPDDMLNIQLEVIPGGRKFPVKIKADEEELVREATRQLRLKFLAYKQAFSEAGISDEDLMTMVAIDIATSHLRLEKNRVTDEKLQQLDNELKDYLKEQKA